MFFARNSRIGAVSTFVYLRLSVLILNGDFLRYSSTAKITISRRLLRNRHYSPLPTRILRSILGSLYHYGEIGTDGYRWAEPGSEGDLVRWKLGTRCLRNSRVSIRCCYTGSWVQRAIWVVVLWLTNRIMCMWADDEKCSCIESNSSLGPCCRLLTDQILLEGRTVQFSKFCWSR